MQLSQRILPVVLFTLLCGLAYRLYPVFLGQPSLSEAFMTEDGYLMLTIARNMAVGLGMTVSDGTIATNGVQPLATFVFTVPYLLTGGDKVVSLIGIHLIHAVAAAAGVFAVRALAGRVLAALDPAAPWPWLVATLWFLGPLLVFHSMNGLETGIYTLVLVATLLQFARVLDRGVAATLVDRLTLGALCGLVFLSRNDAAILAIVVFVIWALIDWFRNGTGFAGMLAHLIPP